MKIGIMSDIHCDVLAMRTALEQLEQMGPMDLLLCAGDSVLQYRFSNEIFDLLREHHVLAVRGNHDQMVASSAGAQLRASGRISPENLQALEEMPNVLELHIEGKRLVMMHTSPVDPGGGGRDLQYAGTPARNVHFLRYNRNGIEPLPAELIGVATVMRDEKPDPAAIAAARAAARAAALADADDREVSIDAGGNVLGGTAMPPRATERDEVLEAKADILVVGHTHQPGISMVGNTLVINPGSLGQPRNPLYPIRRTYAVLDTATWEATIGEFQQEL